jgi:hypothetical protein
VSGASARYRIAREAAALLTAQYLRLVLRPGRFGGMRTRVPWLAIAAAGVLAGCGGKQVEAPEKLDGTVSREFEQDDRDTAAGASDVVKDYCSDAVSEAQRVGCEAHVTEDEIP